MEVDSHQPRPRPADRPPQPVPRPRSSGGEAAARLVTGHAGDHALVHALLRAANQAPSYEDFITWLDEPTYEPSDRLLVKHGNQIVAHLQLLHRTAWFEDVRLPIGSAQDLAVLPEYLHAGYDRQLIDAAERSMRGSQAIVSLIRSSRPESFRAAGWIDVRAGGYSQASIGDVLAHLSVQPSTRQRRARALRIRRWRHVEMEAARAVYTAAAATHWGAIYRAEPYWQWLIGRKAHSDIVVAVDGPDEWDDLTTEPAIVGYAVTAGAQVLELCCLPDFARAAPRLLVRTCQDAIERDHHTLTLHTAASDPLHELMVTAGGTWCTDDRHTGGTLLVKLLDSPRWIEAIYPILRRRAKGAGLPRPLAICFDTLDEQYRLVLTRRSSRLVADETTTADVRCDPTTFSALLVGNLNVAQARKECRLDVANDDVLHKLAVLFPPSLFWQSQFDTLRF
jgi:ribosomal protein S18 acetylase RimI-like enzyme